jgi:phosphatidate cytidylyltransferase
LAAAEARNPLLTRLATGIVLIIVALGAVWLGGMAFTALVAAATLLMFAEWAVMHRLGRGVRLAGLVLLAGVITLMQLVTPGEAVMTLGAGAASFAIFVGVSASGVAGAMPGGPRVSTFNRHAAASAAGGVLYAGLPAVALIWVRGLPQGLEATVFLLVCVWATDIVAFFTGRAIGGPKLAPSISPNKTWAGAIGGVIGATVIAGGIAAAMLPDIAIALFLALAAVLAALSVLGDLLESHLKRRAGVKDSGNILPGHGGVMDRLDGLVPVAVAGAGVFALTGWAG